MKQSSIKLHHIIIVLAIIAIINAIYLTTIAYGSPSFCDINETLSCGSVFAFNRSWIGPIPFPLVAVIVYPVLGFLAWKGRDYDTSSIKRWKLTGIVSALGIAFNSYFLINEIISAVYCPLCLICLAIIITICISSRRQYHILTHDQQQQ